MQMHNVEDIYPLSPMQQGLLFHTRSAPESALYFEQWLCLLRGDLDIEAFWRAWQHVVSQHPALRTLFIWEDLDEPLQVVRQHVQVPREQHDWRELPAGEQSARLDALLLADQARGFELTHAPLMRLQLIRMAGAVYQFIWSFHHILLDGWSLGLVFHEIIDCYASLRRHQELPIVARRPYRDYIAWLQQQDPAPAEAFWRETLKGFTTPTPLAIDRYYHENLGSHTYLDREFHLSATQSDALLALARTQQLTLSTLIQGAWAILLSRYSGETDVVFGTVVAGRPQTLAQAEAIVGLCINTLPTRARPAPEAWLLPWLTTFQRQQLDAWQFEYSPLAQVQQWSEVRGGLPLFETLVTFENYPAGTVAVDQDIGGIVVTGARIIERTNYPLTLAVIPGSELAFKLSYAADRFDPGAIDRLAGHFQALLKGIAANPLQRIGDLPLLAEEERRQIVFGWNATQVDYPGEQYLHTIIEEQVSYTPDAVALVFEDIHLTYQALNRRANQLAHYLRRLGVGPEILAGVCMERSPELVIALLGILKAGGAYVPLDPSYPAERLALMLEDSRVALVLTTMISSRDTVTRRHGDKVMDSRDTITLSPLHPVTLSGLPVVDLEANWPTIAREPDTNPERNVAPDNLAYMIYTSGSTGHPKGVLNTHRAITNRLRWMQDTYCLTAVDRVLQKTPYSFDVSVWEFFWPLMTGAQLIVARPGGHQDRAYLAALIAEQQITTLHFVPSMLRVFLQERDHPPYTSLRRVICSGEALPPDLQERFFACIDAELRNLYGPTEAAVDVTFWPCERGSALPTIPIGRPIANTQMYILDARLQPLPIGVAGELYIGGVQLARGYLGRPDLTADRFVPNPFERLEIRDWRLSESELPISNLQSLISSGTRLYKTGDRARYLPDGSIEYLGRLDDQVKLRGFRIEPGEIEAALRQHPAIRDAIVVLREDIPGDARLVAYVLPTTNDRRPTTDSFDKVTRRQGDKVTGSGQAITPSPLHPFTPSGESVVGGQWSMVGELRAFLKERLPSYMVPSAFVLLEAVPLSPNGKINRRALPAPAAPAPAQKPGYTAPKTAVEQTIASIWQEVLRVDAVGLHDNFFDLGGHSLLMAQVYSKLRAVCGDKLSILDLLRYPTINTLTTYLSQQAAPPPPPPADLTEEKLRAGRQRLRQQLRQREH